MHTVKRNYPVKRNHTFPSLFHTFFNELEKMETASFKNTLPAVNVKENDDNFQIELAAPGLAREDFKVNVHEGVLTISSEKKTENEENKDNYTRREFAYSTFKRSFNLPETVDTDAISASYTDGVLTLTLPKKEEAKPQEPKAIEVA